MAAITLEYNAHNRFANKMIEFILSLDNVFKVKTDAVATSKNADLTLKAMQDVEVGKITHLGSYADYLKKTKKYA
jgi:hypothetical protein